MSLYFVITVEIVIVNKNAIVMAADSAVTVGRNKTYNGMNKLFMLSSNPRRGIMVFELLILKIFL